MTSSRERCNCDASCGENRYHDLGSPGCRYQHSTELYLQMAKTPIQDLIDDSDDFGFSFTDDLEKDLYAAQEQSMKDQKKADQMYKLIMPLLNNLKKNPDKPNIHWPDRVKKIDDFIYKLNAILDN